MQKTQNPQNGKIPENCNSKTQNSQTNKRDRHQTHPITPDRPRTHKAASVIGMEPTQLSLQNTDPTKFCETQNPQTQHDRLGVHKIMCDRHTTHKPTRVICMEPIQLYVIDTEPLNQQIQYACNLYNYV